MVFMFFFCGMIWQGFQIYWKISQDADEVAPSEVNTEEKDIGLRLDKPGDIAGEDSLDI